MKDRIRTTGKRLIRLFGVVLAVTAITFVLVDFLPGNIAYDIAGEEATMEDIEALQKELGLDRPVIIRYGNWLADIAKGDLGKSFRTQEPVLEAILSRLPVTIELMVLSQLFALALAVPLGILSAYKPRTIIDNTLSSIAFAMMSIPVFVMGLVLIYIFAIKLQWLPATGYMPLSDGIQNNLRSFLLPALCIAMVEWVPFMRVLRSDMIATLQENFILMAKSKGLPASHILFRHALRPSSLTLITILGIHMGHLIGGAVIVEIIFALPGIGRLLIGSIFSRDFAMVQGCILFITIAYVGVNFLVDYFYGLVDPRIRISGMG
ncbi:ABC transporter permease [Desulfospira joergensenii]|uniref:ABC transporter permease n=1 Tax=Desulfospira joergensenii TaxID=53329 RepID=UPI0003B6FE93|nr:ABC transporter permease [Desulfospira joergensenii]